MSKYFDAKEVEQFVDFFEDEIKKYGLRADCLEYHLSRFVDNQEHKGEDAEVAKLLVKDKEIGFLNEIRMLNKKLNKLYLHSKEEFHRKVDSAPDAKIDVETLRIVEKDFKRFSKVHSEHGGRIEQIADTVQNQYGHLLTFTQPTFNHGREYFYELCGGNYSNAGLISNTITRFLKYDEEEREFIKASGYEEEVDDLNNRIIKTSRALNLGFNAIIDAPKYSLFRIKMRIKYIFEDGYTEEEADALCQNIDYVKKTFDFTNEELEVLAKYYPDLIEKLCNMSAEEAAELVATMKVKISYLQDAHSLVEQYNLTEEQKEYIYNLENLIGHKYDDVDYSIERVAGLEVIAAALFEYGKSPEFVACVLGNCCAEHCIGGTEISKGSSKFYVIDTVDYFSGRGIDYNELYSNKLIYELEDDGAYLNEMEYYMDHENPTYVIGIGTCQWTPIDRLQGLIDQYKIEMGIDIDEEFDRDITFIEAARAEAKFLVSELESGTFSSSDENFVDNVGPMIDYSNYENNEEAIKNGARQFFVDYERGEDSSVPKRDNSAWNIYVVMNGGKIQ
ncbi:MAG: hypothetical protein E7275_07810 [Pseudobutyrivibrio sp.]|uniref:phage tail tip lysozyme n=1 Tax=Pseudobutyrivibrio sp. TaxID=2014367 RepID=UPI0025D39A01|nr:phage tail tip lysozyme [Pseudobutyrivibrio sp.]MBE5904179.1 hypothetical protein [Pseudobutyrivibrio sp.]